jgi:hypothetical protein
MSDYRVVADTGQSLINVLWQEIQADSDLFAIINDQNLISLDSPAAQDQGNDSALLSVYLYRIVENAYLKNGMGVEGTGGRTRSRPLMLDLDYLITPLLKLPRERQIVLGKVMQVFHDHSSIEGADLAGSLAGDNVLRVVLKPLSLEELARVWQALETSYRLSVCYTVRVAMLDSTSEAFLQPVVGRETAYGGN